MKHEAIIRESLLEVRHQIGLPFTHKGAKLLRWHTIVISEEGISSAHLPHIRPSRHPFSPPRCIIRHILATVPAYTLTLLCIHHGKVADFWPTEPITTPHVNHHKALLIENETRTARDK